MPSVLLYFVKTKFDPSITIQNIVISGDLHTHIDLDISQEIVNNQSIEFCSVFHNFKLILNHIKF